MNKVLVKLYVPNIDEQYDIWLPINKKLYKVIVLLIKAVYDFSDGQYNPKHIPKLYDKATAKEYDINLNAKEANIRNGTEIILI